MSRETSNLWEKKWSKVHYLWWKLNRSIKKKQTKTKSFFTNVGRVDLVQISAIQLFLNAHEQHKKICTISAHREEQLLLTTILILESKNMLNQIKSALSSQPGKTEKSRRSKEEQEINWSSKLNNCFIYKNLHSIQ